MNERNWGRSIVFIGGNAAVLAALYALLLSPARDLLQDQQSRIEQAGPRLEQARSSRARNDAVSALDPAAISSVALWFLQGETASLLNADLLTRLRQVAENHGVSFTSVAALPEREWLGRQLIGARVEFSATNRRVAEVLSAIEHGRSFLFIRRAQLSAASEKEASDGTIIANIEVYGVTGWP